MNIRVIWSTKPWITLNHLNRITQWSCYAFCKINQVISWGYSHNNFSVTRNGTRDEELRKDKLLSHVWCILGDVHRSSMKKDQVYKNWILYEVCIELHVTQYRDQFRRKIVLRVYFNITKLWIHIFRYNLFTISLTYSFKPYCKKWNNLK